MKWTDSFIVISSLESLPKTFHHLRRGMCERVWKALGWMSLWSLQSKIKFKCKSALEPVNEFDLHIFLKLHLSHTLPLICVTCLSPSAFLWPLFKAKTSCFQPPANLKVQYLLSFNSLAAKYTSVSLYLHLSAVWCRAPEHDVMKEVTVNQDSKFLDCTV